MNKNYKYSLNENFFQEINTEEKAYWLGFLMADGCILDQPQRSKRLTIALKKDDISILHKLNSSLESNSKVHECKIKTGKFKDVEYCKLSISNEKLCQDLISLGCTPRKSLTLKFPDIKDELIHHFIRGYFDGDGSVFTSNEKHHRSKKIIKIIYVDFTGNKEFLESMFNKTNIGTIKCIKKTASQAYNYRVKRNPRCKLFYEYLYKDANIYLERKKIIFDDYFK